MRESELPVRQPVEEELDQSQGDGDRAHHYRLPPPDGLEALHDQFRVGAGAQRRGLERNITVSVPIFSLLPF